MSEAVVLDRGPIRLYEDIIQALYKNTHLMTSLLTNDLKLQYFPDFFVVVITIQLIKTWYDCMMT
jgi:hypothetical protein